MQPGSARYLLYASQPYALAILRPLQRAIRERGGTSAWFFDGPGARYLLEDERPAFRFDLAPRALSDFEPGCAFHQTAASHFTRGTICTLATAEGRVTLKERTLVRTVGEHKTETELTSDAEVREAYRAHFGVELDR